jgi:phosphohistidine phosphatase
MFNVNGQLTPATWLDKPRLVYVILNMGIIFWNFVGFFAGGGSTMKTILLMRHAKSSWKDTDLSDIDRPLNKRGRHDAPLMGEVIKEKELCPQIILSSTAVRARQTAEYLAGGCEFTGDIQYRDDFYLAEPPVYLDALSGVAEPFERVMVIGHNPGLEGLLQVLTGRIEALPTGALAFVSLPISTWAELTGELEGELVELILPAEVDEKEEALKKAKGSKKEEKKPDKKDEKKVEKKGEKKEQKKVEKKDEKKEDKKGKGKK